MKDLAANVRAGHARGWSFTPLHGKVPTLAKWQARPRETLDEALRWAAAGNVGLRTGAASGVVVIDVDHPNLSEWLAGIVTVRACTGSGKWHVYFAVPPGVTIGNSVGKLGPGIDVRGDGGQVVFPGSIHPESGEPYRWDAHASPDDVELAPLPPDILARLMAPPPRATATSTGHTPPTADRHAGTTKYGRAALVAECAAVASARPSVGYGKSKIAGERNHALNHAAWQAGRVIAGGELDESEARDALLQAARLCGLPDVEARKTIESGIGAGKLEPKSAPLRDGNTTPPPPKPQFISAGAMIAQYPTLRPVVIDGLLREGETMNVIAPSKRGKSWLTLAAGLAMVTGREWLGFQTTPGDVLILDNELHPETIARRIVAVADALGIARAEYADRLYVESLRGRLADLRALEYGYFSEIIADHFRLVICDAWYRFQGREDDENSNACITSLYNVLDRIAAKTRAAFLLVHHASKGNQSEKSVTDTGSGAGAQSRAADAHLVLREHETDGAVVLEAAVRSFPPTPPRCLRWSFPVWTVADDLDAANLKRSSRRRSATPEVAAPKPEPWTVDRFVVTYLTAEPVAKGTVIARATVGGVMSERKAGQLLALAIADKRGHVWVYPKSSTQFVATVPQPVTETVTAPDTPPARARTPHTPRERQKPPRGGVRARADRGTPRGGK